MPAPHARPILKRFEVWFDNQAQWDPDDIDPPNMVCKALNASGAAEQLASMNDDDTPSFIVRDSDGKFHQIQLRRSWMVKSDRSLTLEELCAL